MLNLRPLSAREREVLRCWRMAWTMPRSRATLAVAVSTVKAHINHIFGKLGVHNRLEAVLRAQELSLLYENLPRKVPNISLHPQPDRANPTITISTARLMLIHPHHCYAITQATRPTKFARQACERSDGMSTQQANDNPDLFPARTGRAGHTIRCLIMSSYFGST